MSDLVKQMRDLAQDRNRAHATWTRHLLTIASGGLALLVGLKPEIPPDDVGKWLLSAAWTLLGAGIVSGGAATYAEVSLARNLARTFQSQLLRRLEETDGLEADGPIPPLSAAAGWGSRVGCVLMPWFLSGAVACFVGYSIRQILLA